MIAPSPLAKWREAREWSYRKAARFFGISPDFYRALEDGRTECSPSLAMEISQKTDLVVMPGDLPGCEITCSDAAPCSGDCRDAAPAGVASAAPEPIRDGGVIAPPDPVAVDEGAAGAASSSHASAGDVWNATVLEDRLAGDAVLLHHTTAPRRITGCSWSMTPLAASELGMALIRAAIAARPFRP